MIENPEDPGLPEDVNEAIVRLLTRHERDLSAFEIRRLR